MPYTNAESILPPELVSELQKYVAGQVVYIPLPRAERLRWGQKNGTRARNQARNAEIRALKADGLSIDALADRYCLTTDAIRKILYTRNPDRLVGEQRRGREPG